jgi:HSP20 family protein
MNAIMRSPQRGWELFGDFNDITHGIFNPNRHAASADQAYTPAIDIVETSKGYEVRADLPGMKKENLSVTVKEELLTIEAEPKVEDSERDGETVIKKERRSGKYSRTLKLGRTIDGTKISAEYSDGVLTLMLPKAEEAVSRKIEVAVH